MSTIPVAVIGCGTIANSAHIPSYEKDPRAKITWFCDIIPERAEAARDAYGSGKVTTDYREVLQDPDVKAVSVCTPNNVHAEITIAALEAGKDVLCEKPAARTYAEAEQMLAAKQRTGRTLNIGVVNRFNDAVNQIKQRIDAGELGTVHHVYVSFRAHRSIPGIGGAFTTHAIAGGGALIDWGVHYLDIVMYCLGDPEAKTVSAETFSVLGRDIPNYVYESMWAENTADMNGVYDVDDSITALVRTTGPVVTVMGAWAQNIGVGEAFIDFMGDKAGIRLQYGGGFTVYGTDGDKLTEEVVEAGTGNMFAAEIASFLDCVESGQENPARMEQAILTSRMMQAMYDSAAAHREVVLD
ncbi:MAG: Gfo/Idh/MocA family oxidoreductase [Bacillota bacterium]|nr:Gfo/Idh/MocA family oxidoreductase [Bacillota bacterium]